MRNHFTIVSTFCVLVCASGAFAAVVASDSANDPAYSDGWQIGDNGGSGFGPWREIEAIGGGIYIENSGRQIGGPQSFAIYAGGSSGSGYGVDRPLATPLTDSAFSVLVRNDLDNASGFSGINLKSTADPTFGIGEMLSIGMEPTSVDASANNNDIVINGDTPQYLYPDGTTNAPDLRGAFLQYTVGWNTNTDEYIVTVSDLTNGGIASVTGHLKFADQAVAAIGFGNFNSGDGQNFIFNQLALTSLPEPGGVLVFGGALVALSRKRQKTIHRPSWAVGTR